MHGFRLRKKWQFVSIFKKEKISLRRRGLYLLPSDYFRTRLHSQQRDYTQGFETRKLVIRFSGKY